MNAADRIRFVENLRALLEEQTYLSFRAFPSWFRNERQTHNNSLHWYFRPTSFQFVREGVRMDKRIGFKIDFENSSADKNHVWVGFELVHQIGPANNLIRAMRNKEVSARVISRLTSNLDSHRLYATERAISNRNRNLGDFLSIDQDIYARLSGWGSKEQIELNERTWEDILKKPVWTPDGISHIKHPKCYLTIQELFQIPSGNRSGKNVQLHIAQVLLAAYMPILEACTFQQKQTRNLKRPNPEKLRRDMHKLYPEGPICAVTGKHQGIDRCHLVPSRAARNCNPSIQSQIESPRNVIYLAADLHKGHQEPEEWYVGKNGQIYNKRGKRIITSYISRAHRRLLRDLRRAANLKTAA